MHRIKKTEKEHEVLREKKMGQTLEKLVNVENMLKIFYMRFLENKQNKYNDTIMLNM